MRANRRRVTQRVGCHFAGPASLAALSKRDRSLITVAALVATYRPEQLVSHLTRAIANGVTQEEITEVITHMAFYAGWPAAMLAAQVAYTVLVEGNKGE